MELAEKDQLEEAEKVLNDAIAKYPGVASAFNNRAQVRQFLRNHDGALSDLEEAIKLSSSRSPRDVLTLRQALTQRGILRRLEGKDDEARKDLEQAADLGSAVAKQEATKLNPYAASCNEMMVQMMAQFANFHKKNV